MAKDLSKLFATGDVSSIISLIEIDGKLLVRIAPRIINYLLDKGDIDTVSHVWGLLAVDPAKLDLDKCDTGLGILALKYLIAKGYISSVFDTYESLHTKGIDRKKTIMIIIDDLITREMYKDAVSAYVKYVPTYYTVETSDISKFIHLPKEYFSIILEHHVGFPHLLEESYLPKDAIVFDPETTDGETPDGFKLEMIPLTSVEKSNIIDFVNLNIDKTKKERPTIIKCSPTYVIDAANVLYYGDRAITSSSYKRLETMINSLSGTTTTCIQVVIHEKYCKPQKTMSLADKNIIRDFFAWIETQSHVSLLKTPYGMNDDWISILSAVTHGATLITNDKFRDHKYGLSTGNDLFGIWCKENTVGFQYTRSNALKLDQQLKWSYRVQRSDKNYYIPLTNGKWIQIPVT